MKKLALLLCVGFLMGLTWVCRGAGQDPKVVKPDLKPVVSMVITEGYGGKEVEHFSLYDDGTFLDTFRTFGKEGTVTVMEGKLSEEQSQELRKELGSAGKGPEADDAGTVLFKWKDKDGTKHEQLYSLPGKTPAADLIGKVRALVKEKGKVQPPVKAQ